MQEAEGCKGLREGKDSHPVLMAHLRKIVAHCGRDKCHLEALHSCERDW